jgi:hypothetical protein
LDIAHPREHTCSGEVTIGVYRGKAFVPLLSPSG